VLLLIQHAPLIVSLAGHPVSARPLSAIREESVDQGPFVLRQFAHPMYHVCRELAIPGINVRPAAGPE
jgi:hypothetical protein